MESTVIRQVRHVLSIDPDKTEVSQALEALQELGIRVETRGGLKSALKQNTVQLYREFLQQYRPLVSQVTILSSTCESLSSHLSTLHTDLTSIESLTSETVKSGRSLQTQRDILQSKQLVLSNLLSKLSLSHDEIELLTAAETPVTQDYFQMLKKLLEIKSRAETLQHEGYKLMSVSVDEYLTQIQESAYEKIFRFMQAQARMLEHDNFTGYDQYATAVKYLRERPLYYDHFRTEIIRCRQLYWVRKFQEVQGGEGEEGLGRVLAWVHSALVSEQQLVAAILESVESVPQSTDSLQETTVLDLIADSLTRHFSIKSELLIARLPFKSLSKAFSQLDFSLKSFTDSNLLTYTSKLVQELFRLRTLVEEKLIDSAKRRIAHVKALGLQLQDLRIPTAYIELIDDLVDICKDLAAAEASDIYTQVSEVVLGGGLGYYEDLVTKSQGATAAYVMLLNVCDYCKFKLAETEMALTWMERLEKKIQDIETELMRKGRERAMIKGEDMTMTQLNRIREILEGGDVSEFLPIEKVRNKNVAKRLQSGVVTTLVESYAEGYQCQKIKPECRPEDLADQVRRSYL